MKRGDLVTVAVSGDYGKPRPALVVQADAFDLHPSVIVLPLTSELHDAPLFRVTVERGQGNRVALNVADHGGQSNDRAARQNRTADRSRERAHDAGSQPGTARLS